MSRESFDNYGKFAFKRVSLKERREHGRREVLSSAGSRDHLQHHVRCNTTYITIAKLLYRPDRYALFSLLLLFLFLLFYTLPIQPLNQALKRIQVIDYWILFIRHRGPVTY